MSQSDEEGADWGHLDGPGTLPVDLGGGGEEEFTLHHEVHVLPALLGPLENVKRHL